MKRLVLAVFLLLQAFAAQATTLPQVPLAELFARADVVALVEIVRGQVLGSGETSCGAAYEAHVIESLKGEVKGDSFRFGYYVGYEIGNRYVLFLVKQDNTYDPKTSTNGGIEHALQLGIARCKTLWPGLLVMHSGFGALPVNWSPQFEYKDSVRIAGEYVGMPAELPSKVAKPSESEEYSSVVWVRLEDLLQTLRALRK